MGTESLKVGSESFKVGIESLKVGTESLKVGIHSLKVGIESFLFLIVFQIIIRESKIAYQIQKHKFIRRKSAEIQAAIAKQERKNYEK